MSSVEFKIHNGVVFGFVAEDCHVSYLRNGDLVTIAGVSCEVREVTTVDGFDRIIFSWAGATSWKLVGFRNQDWSGFDLFLSDPQTV